MYSAFDSYLAREAWFSGHAMEDQAFNHSLQQVVDDPMFSADAMGDYMRAAKQLPYEDRSSEYAEAISRRVMEAFAIRDFLKQTGR